MNTPPPHYFYLKETKPQLGGGKISSTTNDLVEHIHYLYVRVVKARDLPSVDVTGSCDPYVEARLGNYRGVTRHVEKNSNPDWNQVLAFPGDRIQSTTILEVTVKDKDLVKDEFMGCVLFDLTEVPNRAESESDSPVTPQWYRLEDRKGKKVKGEIMLSVWWGTQDDEGLVEVESWDSATVGGIANFSSKVYPSPKLWYLRVNVIEAQGLVPSDPTRSPEVFVKAVLGHQDVRSKVSKTKSINPKWNEEELIFVAAEPFEEHLILTVEDRVGPDRDEVLGMCAIPLQYVDRRVDNKPVKTRWFNLLKNVMIEGESKKEVKFASRICIRICLEGGYHVLDGSTSYSSDFRPTAKELWKDSIGVLEVGILGAHGLSPGDGKATADAYCVAKYGTKWVKTRTIRNSLRPRWNEQYTWEVFDPCTVLTVGVFDNCDMQSGGDPNRTQDSRIGKVRIRVSTLVTDCVYTHLYPLIVLLPSGVKKAGEIHLAVRFSCTSMLKMMHMYSQPLLPDMHYIRPLTIAQLDILRHQATQIVSMRLSRVSPPLRKEVVEYMLELNYHMWSIRRSKANFFRIIGLLSGLVSGIKWIGGMYNLKNPITTVVTHIIFFILVMHPKLILPSVFLSLFLTGASNYRHRPRHPPHIDTLLSQAHNVNPDELDEEFDPFPTSHGSTGDILSKRYDRLRSIFGRVQIVIGDIATQGERLQSLLNWRDPIATTLFVFFCLIAAIVLYATPFYVVTIQTAIYVLTHLCFPNELPSVPINFFRRLPSRIDQLL